MTWTMMKKRIGITSASTFLNHRSQFWAFANKYSSVEIKHYKDVKYDIGIFTIAHTPYREKSKLFIVSCKQIQREGETGAHLIKFGKGKLRELTIASH
jgi:hypothetical protein